MASPKSQLPRLCTITWGRVVIDHDDKEKIVETFYVTHDIGGALAAFMSVTVLQKNLRVARAENEKS